MSSAETFSSLLHFFLGKKAEAEKKHNELKLTHFHFPLLIIAIGWGGKIKSVK
jgi:hypothetical protein